MRLVITAPEDMIEEACERINNFCERHYRAPSKKSSDNIANAFRGATVHDSPVCENSGRNLS